MSVENARYAAVNLSSMYIPVYSSLVYSGIHVGGKTAGGTQIGKIYPNECYTVIPNDSFYVTSYKIYFRNSNGQGAYGYIETSKGDTLGHYAWDAHQHPYHYYNSNGKSLVASAKCTIDGVSHRIFTINKYISIRTPGGVVIGSMNIGEQVALRSSTTGQTYPGYIISYYRRKNSTAEWSKMTPYHDYAFVDLALEIGNMPYNRAIL